MKLGIFREENDVFWMTFSLLLLGFVFCGHENFAISEYGIPMVALLAIGLVKYIFIKEKILNFYNIVFIIMLCCLLFNFLIRDSNFNSGFFDTYLIYFILGFLVSSISITKRQLLIIECSYIFSATTLSLWIFLFPQIHFSGRISTSFLGGPIFEFNYLAFYLIAASILAIFILISKKNNKVSKFFFIIAAFINGLGAFFTGSRSGLYALVVFFLLLCLTYFIKRKNLGRLLRYSVIGLTSGLLFIIISQSILGTDISNRLFSSLDDQSNAKRVYNWKCAWETIKKNPILGYGISTSPVAIKNTLGVYTSAHNSFLDFWINHGVIPFFILLCLYFKMLKELLKKRKIEHFSFLVAMLFAENLVLLNISMTFWCIIYFSIKEIQLDSETTYIIKISPSRKEMIECCR